MGRFENKVVVVTGAGSGIGRSTAIQFAKEGAKVVVSDIDEASTAAVAEAINLEGGTAMPIVADVAKADDVSRLFNKTIEAFGGLDVAINNAGVVGTLAPTHELTIEQYDHVMNVNCRGVFLCMKAEIEYMRENGGGSIVNISSVAGMRGFPNLMSYTGSKHAVLGMTRAVALEYAKENIRVNAICPGVIDTPMIDEAAGSPEGKEAYREMEPLGRMGTPEEVGELIVWLSSDQSGFVTGADWAIDGGLTAG